MYKVIKIIKILYVILQIYFEQKLQNQFEQILQQAN